jgi:hypothetical protein
VKRKENFYLFHDCEYQ